MNDPVGPSQGLPTETDPAAFSSDANTRLETGTPPTNVPVKRTGWVEWLRSLDTWWSVLLLLFLVTGILGVPIIWISRSFSPLMKVVLTIAVSLYTFFLVGIVMAILVWAYQTVTGL